MFPDEDRITDEANKLIIQTDGSSAQKKGGVRAIITTPDGEVLKYGVQLKFPATNNEAKYEGILTRHKQFRKRNSSPSMAFMTRH